jgi:hypothetical protein
MWMTISSKRGCARPINAIEPFVVLESVVRERDEADCSAPARNRNAAGGCTGKRASPAPNWRS